jgi:hypothetical protein
MALALTKPARKSVNEKIYESLSRRLEPFAKKLKPEDRSELDGAISIFADDVADAFRVVMFFGKLK